MCFFKKRRARKAEALRQEQEKKRLIEEAIKAKELEEREEMEAKKRLAEAELLYEQRKKQKEEEKQQLTNLIRETERNIRREDKKLQKYLDKIAPLQEGTPEYDSTKISLHRTHQTLKRFKSQSYTYNIRLTQINMVDQIVAHGEDLKELNKISTVDLDQARIEQINEEIRADIYKAQSRMEQYNEMFEEAKAEQSEILGYDVEMEDDLMDLVAERRDEFKKNKNIEETLKDLS